METQVKEWLSLQGNHTHNYFMTDCNKSYHQYILVINISGLHKS